jgi:hypothetical protein
VTDDQDRQLTRHDDAMLKARCDANRAHDKAIDEGAGVPLPVGPGVLLWGSPLLSERVENPGTDARRSPSSREPVAQKKAPA